ncbi:MAG: AEC family transporter [Oscillospiraceae bacterium]
MNSAAIIAFQAVVMFVLLAVGYFLYRKNWLDSESTRRLSNITISIINPIVIFNAYQRDFDSELLKGLLSSLVLAVISHIVLILCGIIAVRKSSKNFQVERFALVYSNCAFMGIPLVEAVFGSEGVLYLTGYITVFNILLWTHGVICMGGAGTGEKGLLKILISPPILSIILGLLFFFFGWRLPEVLQQPLNYLGSMNTPLAMLVSGATIAKAGLGSAFRNKRVYYVQLFKLVAAPAVLIAAFVPLTLTGLISPDVVKITVIAAAAPTASSTIMFAYKFGKNERYAANQFAVSTLFSVVTLPLILLLTEAFERLIA